MKILIHDYAGHPFQVQLSRELASRGHQVKHAYAAALQTPRGDLQKRDDDPLTFSVTEVAMDPDYAKYKYSFLRRRRMEMQYGAEVAKLISEFRPDVVLSSNTPTETQQSIVDACENSGAKFVYWLQDFYSIAVDKLLRKKIPVAGRWIGSYYKRLEMSQLQRSDAVVAITEDFTPILVEQYGIDENRIEVISNWAPLGSIPIRPKENDWSRELELSDKFCFLYTGTLGMKHNPELLAGLAQRFNDRDDVRIVVVSEGLGAEWLKNEKQKHGLENLVLLPYQPFSELPSVLATGDVLLGVLEDDAGVFSVPSKVLTYLCAGRSILLAVPEVNLASRIIRERKAGLTVQPADATGFYTCADNLYKDRNLRLTCATNARAYAERTFNIRSIAAQFEEVLVPVHNAEIASRPDSSRVAVVLDEPARVVATY